MTPVFRIPIVGPQALADARPDSVVILAWNFADEILRLLAPLREQGVRCVVPLPQPRVL